eukprot:629366-Rhodomonas_salina.2
MIPTNRKKTEDMWEGYRRRTDLAPHLALGWQPRTRPGAKTRMTGRWETRDVGTPIAAMYSLAMNSRSEDLVASCSFSALHTGVHTKSVAP